MSRVRVLKEGFQTLKTSMTRLHIAAAVVFFMYLVSNLFWKDRLFRYTSVCAIIIAYFPLLSSASAASRFRVPIVYYLILGTCCAVAHLYSCTADLLRSAGKTRQEKPSIPGKKGRKKNRNTLQSKN